MEKSKRSFLPWGMVSTILTLAWPTMLEELMQTAVQYIDTAMVGAIGTQATAAVGATSTVNWLIGSTVAAIGVGFLSFVSQACGAGDTKRAGKASSQAVLAVLVCGTFFTVLMLALSSKVPVWMQVDPAIQDLAAQYFFILYTPMLARAAITIFGTLLRSAGDAKTPMRVGFLVNGVNVVLNFLLIYPTRQVWGMTVFGAGWGVIGAAVASAISFVIGGVCITVVLWRHPLLSPKGQKLRPDWDVLKPCLRVALPNALQRFGTSLGYVAFASMINSLGEIATAAHTIANTVESAFYIPGYGMQTAAATLAGQGAGADDSVYRGQSDDRLRVAAVPVRAQHDAFVFQRRSGDRTRGHGSADGGGVRAVLRRVHHCRGHDAGHGEHYDALCLQHRGHVGRAHCGHVYLHPAAGDGAGVRVGVHDRP